MLTGRSRETLDCGEGGRPESRTDSRIDPHAIQSRWVDRRRRANADQPEPVGHDHEQRLVIEE